MSKDEIRSHLIRSVFALMTLTLVGLLIIPSIFDTMILAPRSSDFITYRLFEKMGEILPFLPDFSAEAFSVQILNINMTTQFMTYLSSSFAFAVLFSTPYIFYEIWRFVSPALYENETKNIKKAFTFGGVMFIPLIFRFLITFELSSSIENMLSLDSYMSNFYKLILVMGIVFELPLMFWVLSSMGLIYRSFFSNYRRHASVASLVLAAIITPTGDPFSLFVVTIPLYMLWEISAFVVKKEPPTEQSPAMFE